MTGVQTCALPISNGSGTTYTPGSTFTITANATLYAVWSPISVNVIWNTNGGSSGPANQTYTYPNNLTTIPSGPTPPSGYTFNSWRTGPLCTDPGVSTGSLSFASATTVTFYACFTPISYNVTYDLNGGSSFSGGTNPSTTFTVASNYRISSVTGVHSTSGYNFLGWYTAISGGTLVAAGSPWATPGNVTFYAHWGISQYNVGYDANGGKIGRAHV